MNNSSLVGIEVLVGAGEASRERFGLEGMLQPSKSRSLNNSRTAQSNKDSPASGTLAEVRIVPAIGTLRFGGKDSSQVTYLFQSRSEGRQL